MRILFVLTCCLGLACFTQAAKQDDNNPPKKKAQPSPQVVTPKGHVSGNPKLQTHTSKVGTYTPKGNVYSNPKLQTHHNVSKGPLSTLPGVPSKTPGSHFQHFNLANKPNPNIPSAKFQANNHIAGAQNWKGQKYAAFRNYNAQWHDQGWWHSHYGSHIILIGGGYYYWNEGYWYPAWGYDPAYAYYAYDGPIYASNAEMDPGQVVANVQTALQAQTRPDDGQPYYQGEVDGILGPQTRAALAEYQSARGMEPTGAIDEPTLEALDMA